MLKKLLSIYKVPLILSLTVFVTLVAVRGLSDPFRIVGIFIGCALGTFMLDLDYILYAYVLEPKKEFSRAIVGYLKHKDIVNAMLYIQYHKDEITDRVLNSALFQSIFALFAVFVVASGTSLLLKALVLSTVANSMYRLAEAYFEKRTGMWFWALKKKPGKQGVALYSLVLVAIFVYCVSIF
jgi:hypothetical protein